MYCPETRPIWPSRQARAPDVTFSTAMHSDLVAIIARCAECEAHWLPADEARWQAWRPTDDEPPELVFYCPNLRRARVRRRLRITLARRPCRAIRRRLTTAFDQSLQLYPGSGRSRFAARRRRSPGGSGPIIHSPPRCGKAVDNSGCGTAVARWAFERAVRRPYDARPGLKSLERGTRGKKPRKERELLQPFPNVCLRLAVRTAPLCV